MKQRYRNKMNWKARAMTSADLTFERMESIVSRCKPLNYDDAVALIGMILRADGGAVDGVIVQKAVKVVTPTGGTAQKVEKITASTIGEYVSSEDLKTPWLEVLRQAKDDDRLQMAIEQGHLTAVKK